MAHAYARSFAGLCAGAIPLLLDGLPPGRLLDVGCGTGELAVAARGAGHDEVQRLARVAAPGGVVRATIWGTTPPPQALLWNGLLDVAGAVRPPMPRLLPDKDYDRSPDGLAGLLVEAGLAVTHAGTASWRWHVAGDDLWAGLTAVGNFGVLWRAQTDEVQDRLRAAYDDLGDRFAFDVECVVVEARVPRT